MSRPFRSLAALAAVALATAMLPSGPTASAADEGHGAFRPATGFKPSGPHVRVRPDRYRAFRVDTAQVRAELARAPRAGAARATTFSLPTPTGGTESFAVQRTALLSPALAADHPRIRTWAGHAVGDPGTSIALDVTPMGFHASVRPAGGQGSWYVDPAYNERGPTLHLSYYGGALPRQAEQFAERDLPAVQKIAAQRLTRARAGEAVDQRVYRLALVTDPTYYKYFGSNSSNVTAEKVTLMNRVNQIYNDDLAINIRLDHDVQFNTWAQATGANGPCGLHPCWTRDANATGYVQGQIAYCDLGTLQRNQVVLGQLVGASNYDIGHIMLGVNGGGLAGLGVVGGIEKAMGCTGLTAPTGDFMAIDYVAHEMGHQFGGNHTFNGVQSNCSGGNRNRGTSVEPGSGSSVMAYAGICRQDDLQPHTDPYFSQRTLDEVTAYTGAPAAPPVEVQDVSLTGFDSDGDSVTIGYPGSAQTRTLVRGGSGATAYNAANIEAAVEALTGENVTVAGWGYDPYAQVYEDPQVYPATLTAPDDAGFEVMFAADPDPYTANSDRTDMADLQVTPSAGVTAHVGETAKGGAPENQGFQVNPTGNHDPVVTAPADRTIPLRTPFTLKGAGSDPDGDPLVYLWEQNDVGGFNGTGLVDNHKVNGPLFRVFGKYANVTADRTLQYHSPGENHATASTSRTFPDLAQILAGNTNAETGKCPSVGSTYPVPARARNCYSEFLPVAGYVGTAGTPASQPAMHFRLTARDRAPGGGGVGYDEVTLRIDPEAGPFLVSSFANGGKVRRGSKKRITWQVNGTRPLAHNVAIVLSTNNGKTWGRVLKGKTANDGKAIVRIPRKRSRHAWIMIRAVGNYFFDVSDHSFRIR